MKKNQVTVFTIGHSTHDLQTFIAILKTYSITQLIDIRTIPRSYHNPQFNRATLAQALRNRHIGYRYMKNLGGLRHTTKESINTAWKNSSFRGFADYMQTPLFKHALQKLIQYAHKKRVVIMCSEAVPWRCHRSLIGDALLIHGILVENIFSKTNVKPHILTPWAHVTKFSLTYPKK